LKSSRSKKTQGTQTTHIEEARADRGEHRQAARSAPATAILTAIAPKNFQPRFRFTILISCRPGPFLLWNESVHF
jgi:hypothetical protein